MHKSIIYFLVFFASINVFSQDEYFKLPQAKTQKPTYIFNENVIGNEFLIKQLASSEKEGKKNIEEVYVIKDKQNRELSDYYNFTEQGILLVDLKENFISKTQSELNELFGMDKQNKIYIDGYLLESKKFRIALSGVTEIEIVEPDNANGLENRVLNIWTIAKNERYRETVN